MGGISNKTDARFSFVELSKEQIILRFDEVLNNYSIYELLKDYINTLTMEEKVAIIHMYDKKGVRGVEEMFLFHDDSNTSYHSEGKNCVCKQI